MVEELREQGTSLASPEREEARTPLQVPLRPRRSLRRMAQLYMVVLVFILAGTGALVTGFAFRLRAQIATAFETIPPVILVLRAYPHVEEILLYIHRYMPQQDTYRLTTTLRLQLRNLRETMNEIDDWVHSQTEPSPLRERMTEVLFLLRSVEQNTETLIHLAEDGRWDEVERLVGHLERLEARLRTRADLVLSMSLYRQQQALAQARVSLTHLLLIPAGLGLVAVLLTVLQTTLVQQRMVIRPLLNFIQGLQAYTQGNWQFRFPEDRPDEMGLLAKVFNAMAEEVDRSRRFLEQQVQERTYALQRRMAQTHAAADIGRIITMERDLDVILQKAADLLSQRFGFYQVGIFLLDETGQWAVMRAASTEGGKRLIQRGFRLRVGEQGIVGFVAHTGQVRVVEDVTEDPFYYPNPEFPETRSEMALPLQVGEDILGVLDVQSKQPNAFHPDDIATLRIVADLLAVAISNARLFAQQREALETLRRAQQLLTAEAWQQFVEHYLPLGYRYHRAGLQPVDEVSQLPSGNGAPPHVLRIPLTLREHTIATLELHKPDNQFWTPQERDLAQTLAERLAVALETARLFVGSQRRLAWLHRVAEMARLWELKAEEDLARDLVRYVQEAFRWPHVVLYRWDARRGLLEPVAGEAQWTSVLEQAPPEELPGIMEKILQAGKACIDTCVRALHEQTGPLNNVTWALIPLLGGEVPWGVLEIAVDRPRAFTEEDAPVLELLAEEMASALQNARLFDLVQQLLGQHQQLHSLVVELMRADSVEEAMTRAVQTLERLYPDTALAIYRYDEGSQILRLHGHSRNIETVPQALTVTNSPYGQALETGESIDLEANPLTQSLFWNEHASQLIVPLRYADIPLGAIVLQRRYAAAFTPQDRELFTTLGYVLSSVFYNLRLVVDLNRRTQQLRLLYEFSEALGRHTRLQDLFQEAAQRLRVVFDALHCGIALFDPTDSWSTLVATASRTPEAPGASLVGVRFPHQGDESIQRLKRTRDVVVIYNVQESPILSQTIRDILKQRGTVSLILFPLLIRGKVVGSVALDLDDPERRLTEDELVLFRQLVNQLASAYERVQLLETLSRRAERERLVREITTRLRATTDPQEVVRVALQELRRALGAERAQLLMYAEPAPTDGDGESPSSRGVDHAHRGG